MIERICQQCSTVFLVFPSQASGKNGRKAIFCSHKCQAKARVGTKQSEETKLKKSKALTRKIEGTCLYCERKFKVRPSVMKRGSGKFCSNKCYGESKKGKVIPWIKYPLSDETKEKISATRKKLGISGRQWRDPEFVKMMMDARHTRPNKLEMKLEDILNRKFPGMYKYTGDGSLLINGLIPDFANCNGKKEVIEVFGDYWHSINGIRWNYTELGRIMSYNSLGFKCLILWEHEINTLTEEELETKIKVFFRR